MLKHLRSSPITYSQYFIAKKHMAEKLISSIPTKLLTSHVVIEIGPGKGRLSEFLAKRVGKLTLIEVDYNFWRVLKRKYTKARNVHVLCGDFMDYELPTKESYIVVSNLPYFLARTIVFKLLRAKHPPVAMYVMLQKELYKELSDIASKERIAIRVLHNLKRTDFEPVPRVENVFVEIFLKNKKRH